MNSSLPLPGRPVRGSATGRPVMALFDLLGRRGALRILWELRDGQPQGFRLLREMAGDISPTLLNNRLRELREAGVVELADAGYQLSERGHDLLHRLHPLHRWAETWAVETGAADAS